MPSSVILICTIISTLLLTFVYIQRFRGMLKHTYQMNPISPLIWFINGLLATIFLAVTGNYVLVAIALLALAYEVIALVLSITTMRGRAREWKITQVDYACFVLAVSAAISYYLTRDAILGATILFISGIFGELPQLRKAYSAPKTDQINLYVIALVRSLVGVGMLQTFGFVGYSQTLFWLAVYVVEIVWILYCQNRQIWQVRHAVKYAINFCPVEIRERTTYSRKLPKWRVFD